MLQRKEMSTLLINVIITKMLLTFPRMLISNSGNSAWLQAVYNTVTAFLIFIIISKLYKGKKNIIELAEMSGGKPLKIFVGVVVFALLILNYSSIIRVFPETIKIALLQDLNIEIITIVFEVAIAIGAFIGIEAIARVNYLFMPVLAGIFVLFLVLLMPYYRVYNLLPVFGNGLNKIFINGFNTISLYSDMLLLNIFLPYFENAGEAKKSGRRALYISSSIIIVILLAHCLAYPYPASEEFMIPVYQLARMIHLSSFFSRFEAIFQFAWSILLLLYSAIYVYALCHVFKITFGLKYYRPLILSVVLISGIIALIPGSLSQLIENEKWENMIVYPAVFVLLLIFSIASRKYYSEKKGETDERI